MNGRASERRGIHHDKSTLLRVTMGSKTKSTKEGREEGRAGGLTRSLASSLTKMGKDCRRAERERERERDTLDPSHRELETAFD